MSLTPAGQLTTSAFGTPYIIQQLQSNPQITRELLTDISVTLKTPLPTPADFVKNLDRQFQASRAEQRLANSVTSSQASHAGTSKLAEESPTSKQNELLAARHISSEVRALEDLLDASHRLVEESSDSRARSLQGSPARGARSTQDSLLRQTADLAAHVGQTAGGQAYQALLRSSSEAEAGSSVQYDAYAASPDRQTPLRQDDSPQQAGVPLVMATAEGPHAELLHSMCQRRYWDTLDLRQYLARIDKPPHLRLEPSHGLRFPSKARSLLDSIQAWKDMEDANAQAFKNRLQATFLQGSKSPARQTAGSLANSNRGSTDSLRSLASSPTRSPSAKRAVLVAR